MYMNPFNLRWKFDLETAQEVARTWWIPLLSGLIAIGFGAVVLAVDWSVSSLAIVAGIMFVLAGIGSIGAGVFPLDTGGLHSIFALVAFLVFNLEGLGAAAVVVGSMRTLGFIAGGVGLIYTVLMVIGDSGNPAVFGPYGHGGSERMIAYPVMLWLTALGGYLMAGPEPGGGGPTGP